LGLLGRSQGKVPEILKDEILNERVKIQNQVKGAEPGAILRSGYICCSVHHCGDPYLRLCVSLAGISEYDTTVLEFHNSFSRNGLIHSTLLAYRISCIDIYGSKTAAPKIDTEELVRALVTATD
jgi:hypothetical protein